MICKLNKILTRGTLVSFLAACLAVWGITRAKTVNIPIIDKDNAFNEAINLTAGFGTDERIYKILRDLRRCESGGNDGAINPMDKDLTASWGRYQFKTATLYNWAVKYNILPDIEPNEIMNIIMDGELQEKVLIEAIKENGKSQRWWLSQFPSCSYQYRFWNY